jgi:hypothetical protein
MSVVQSVGKKECKTITRRLVSLFLRNGFNTIIVLLYSNDGLGGRKIWAAQTNMFQLQARSAGNNG